ncbi:MAG: hypothetical protein K2V38_14405 [Gemmataceae bacterium]|nr:hypothetical protein [Gemmataceae bacterium]
MRSPNPIYVSDGQVRKRAADRRAERVFVATYLAAALESEIDNRTGYRLSLRYDPADFHQRTRRALETRAVAYLNDVYGRLPTGVSPEQVARNYLATHQGADGFRGAELLYGRHSAYLSNRAVRDGRLMLGVERGRVVLTKPGGL